MHQVSWTHTHTHTLPLCQSAMLHTCSLQSLCFDDPLTADMLSEVLHLVMYPLFHQVALCMGVYQGLCDLQNDEYCVAICVRLSCSSEKALLGDSCMGGVFIWASLACSSHVCTA